MCRYDIGPSVTSGGGSAAVGETSTMKRIFLSSALPRAPAA